MIQPRFHPNRMYVVDAPTALEAIEAVPPLDSDAFRPNCVEFIGRTALPRPDGLWDVFLEFQILPPLFGDYI